MIATQRLPSHAVVLGRLVPAAVTCCRGSRRDRTHRPAFSGYRWASSIVLMMMSGRCPTFWPATAALCDVLPAFRVDAHFDAGHLRECSSCWLPTRLRRPARSASTATRATWRLSPASRYTFALAASAANSAELTRPVPSTRQLPRSSSKVPASLEFVHAFLQSGLAASRCQPRDRYALCHAASRHSARRVEHARAASDVKPTR